MRTIDDLYIRLGEVKEYPGSTDFIIVSEEWLKSQLQEPVFIVTKHRETIYGVPFFFGSKVEDFILIVSK